jgi:hypothetical protein
VIQQSQLPKFNSAITAYWMPRRSLSTGGASRRPVGGA